MALADSKRKLKKLINNPDRIEFIQEFIKFKDTYFNGNFKQASIAIGESREKVGAIFDRARVPQGGEGSLLKETIKTPKNVIKIQDLTTQLKYNPNLLKDKFKNIKGKYSGKDIGNLLGVDVSNKRALDDVTFILKELGVKSKIVTGNIKEYDITDTIKKMSTGFLEKIVKGDSKSRVIRRGLEKEADPNFHRFFASLKSQIRSSSKEAGVYVPRANEDVGHAMSVVVQGKYPKLFKNSNINTLSTFMYQDPVVNTTILTKTGYDSKFDKVLKNLNKLVNKSVTVDSQKKLLNLKKQLDANHKSIINIIKDPKELKLFLSKYPEVFNIKGMDFSFLKGQEKRVPKIDIKIPRVGELFKSSDLYADMSNTDPAFRIGNVEQINPNAKTLKDLSLGERQLFRENVINQNVDNLSRFYSAAGYTADEVTDLTDTLITGGERSQGLSGTKSGIEKVEYLKEVYRNAPKGAPIVEHLEKNIAHCADGCFIKVANANPERIAKKIVEDPKLIRLFRGESFPQRNVKALKSSAKHWGTTLAEMKKDTLSGQWFTPTQAHATSYLSRPGQMKYVDVTPQELEAFNRYKAKVNKRPVKYSRKKLEGLPDAPTHGVTESFHHQIIPRYKLKEMEKAGRLKTKWDLNPLGPRYIGRKLIKLPKGVLEWDSVLGGFVDSANPSEIVGQNQLKAWAQDNPMPVKVGEAAPGILKKTGRALAHLGLPLPTAAMDAYFIGREIEEGKSPEEIARNPLNWLGLATMDPLTKAAGWQKNRVS